MSLLDSLSQWIDKDRAQLCYMPIPSAQVENSKPSQSLKAGLHYIRLRLASMFLKKQTQWFSNWYPVVHSVVRFDFGNQVIEIPNIVDESKLVMEQTGNGDVVVRNFILTPLVPFHGGTISLTAGLFALQGENYLKAVTKTLGNFSSLLSVPQFSLALNVAQPLALGIQEIFTNANAGMHLGLHDSFSQGQLEDGYRAVIRCSPGSINPGELFVVNNELRQGASLQQARPFVSADHMLFRIELLDQRDDWESLKSIQEPFQESLVALRDESQSTHLIRTALLRATLSPDLTAVDKRRVVERLKEKYEDAKSLLAFSGASEAEIQTFDQVMKRPLSAKLALGKGAPGVSEVLNYMTAGPPPAPRADVGTVKRTAETKGLGVIPEVAPELRPELIPELKPIGKTVDFENLGFSVDEDSKTFHFLTRGADVRGNRAKLGGEFDLVFNYAVPDAPVLIEVQGGELDKLKKAEKAVLDIVVIPRGFKLKDSKWVQRATFVNGNIDKEIVFHLQASDTVVDDAGINVIFEKSGAILYEFFIPFELHASLKDVGDTEFKPLSFNLDELAAAQDREGRDARLHIFADGDKLAITFDNLLTDESFNFTTKKLTRSSLGDLLGAIKADLEPVPNDPVWTVVEDPLGPPSPNHKKIFEAGLEKVATAGWSLFKSLNEDPEFSKVLSAIEALPLNSTLSIRTDCAFLPWEILNANEFNFSYPEDIKKLQPVQPQAFWGYRFSIECLLSGEKQSYKSPAATHQKSPAFVSMSVFRTLDKDREGKKFLPGKSHEDLRALLDPVKTELHTKGVDIKSIFYTANYTPTIIYILCHGQNDKPLDPSQREKLEIDEKVFIEPNDIYVPYKYSSGPIVFLNSCSSGASSPLAFSTFLSEFRKKQALGLIATSFPVPITFGSAFGQALIRQYVKHGEPIGKALLNLRRQQLNNSNPIGLFYSLQCPADIKSHTN